MPSNESFILPVAPDELCFDKNEFIKKSFSVDEFLHEHRNAAGLEEMRDDLGIYLKVLRSAMIELINEDYVDFVNLSSNLIGLDQSINGIQSALGQLKEEVLMVKMNLSDTMTDLSTCLQEKKLLKEYSRSIQSLTKVQKSINKLETLLGSQLNSVDNINPITLERAALEYIQLEFELQFCRNLIDFKDRPNKLSEINRLLMSKLEQHFLNSLTKSDQENIERCLRMYATLDETKAAEEIVRKQIVAPNMNSIISESSLQNCPQGLMGIYSQILDVLDKDMKTLIEISGKANAGVKGFNFIINSFWTEVEHRLETHMSSIFAPGNPDLFYQKYKNTLEFQNRLEEIIGNKEKVNNWHLHKQYKSFQTRWNLPVYFQIRFQEIGGALEKVCSLPIAKQIQSQKGSEFQLTPYSVGWSCILKCWSSGVYLQEIFIRFWTLTLQIIARLNTWIVECISGKDSMVDVTVNVKAIDFYVFLYCDTKTFLGKLNDLLTSIMEKEPVNVVGHEYLLEKCFMESKDSIELKLQILEQKIESAILHESSGFIKQVNDIPRVYRKTNKDIPSKPCAYVDQILKPIQTFYEKYSVKLNETLLAKLLTNIFSSLNIQFHTIICDVLTSVQKTEESLRRLKNLREKSTLMISSSSSGGLGMSDDDKIRLQLQVDVLYWASKIANFNIEVNDIDKLPELIDLLEEATKIRVNEEK